MSRRSGPRAGGGGQGLSRPSKAYPWTDGSRCRAHHRRAREDLDEADELYLDEHLADVVRLVDSDLSDDEFRRHPLIALLLARGSRPTEDALL